MLRLLWTCFLAGSWLGVAMPGEAAGSRLREAGDVAGDATDRPERRC